MNFECEKCGVELEPNAKFCTNCGENISQKASTRKKNNDLPKKYLLISFLIGIIPSVLMLRENYDLEHIGFFKYLFFILTSGVPEIYAEIIGGAIGSMLFPIIIVGFTWGIKSLMSKNYQKPISHIFIGTLIISIIMTLKYIG